MQHETNLALPTMQTRNHHAHKTCRTTSVRKQTPTTNNGDKMTFDEWLKHGYDKGFCSPPVCVTHDGIPTTALEDEEFDEGYDPCFHGVRLYDDLQMRNGCEANSSQAVWRAIELGWQK